MKAMTKRRHHRYVSKRKDNWYLKYQNICYVVSNDGEPLYPSHDIKRILKKLNTGRAILLNNNPFIIQLNYREGESFMDHHIALGIDDGTENLGLSAVDGDTGVVLMTEHVIAQIKQVAKHMTDRRQHRKTSRRGERLRRKRRAEANGTTTEKYDEAGRILPGMEKPLAVRDIRDSPTRFLNRKHKRKKWLTPSAVTSLRTKLHAVDDMRRILPITDIGLEANVFDYQMMEAKRTGTTYDPQHGPLHGYANVKELVSARQNEKCFFCEHDIEQYHHVRFRSQGGADTQANIIGVCRECHEKIHKGELDVDVDGVGKRYAGVAIQQQVLKPFAKALKRRVSKGHFQFVDGWDTKRYRDEHGIDKEHASDAACVAAIAAGNIELVGLSESHCYEVVRYRRHNRALIHSRPDRQYIDAGRQLLEGERVPRSSIVARNRHARIGQNIVKQPSLDEFREEHSDVAVSRLAVRPSRYVKYVMNGRVLPGALIEFDGDDYVLAGTKDRGRTFVLLTSDGSRISKPRSKCRIIKHVNGLTYVN